MHYGPPESALNSARDALADPETHGYQDGAGNRPLLEAIAHKLQRDNGIDLARGSRVMVTAGGNMAFVHAVAAITNPGDEVILPVPFYFNHEMAIQIAGCTPVRVKHRRALPARSRRDPRRGDAAHARDRHRVARTTRPGRSTGGRAARRQPRSVRSAASTTSATRSTSTSPTGRRATCRRARSDGAHAHTISMFSLSKAYGFAGWRIGYMAYPEALAGAIAKVQDTILVCAPVISQVAAVAAMDVGPAHCRRYLQPLAEIRDVVAAELRALEPLCTVPPVDGAFYCFVRVNADVDPMTMAERLIQRARRRGDPRHGVRDDRGLLLPGRLRRAAEGDRRRRDRPPGRRAATRPDRRRSAARLRAVRALWRALRLPSRL